LLGFQGGVKRPTMDGALRRSLPGSPLLFKDGCRATPDGVVLEAGPTGPPKPASTGVVESISIPCRSGGLFRS
jgi:hypothetical protein